MNAVASVPGMDGSSDGIFYRDTGLPSLHRCSLVVTAALLLKEGLECEVGSSGDDSTTRDGLSHSPSEFKSFKHSCVYLVPRSWLHNWVKWAAQQSVPAMETNQLKMALKRACEVHDLPVPPSCGGDENAMRSLTLVGRSRSGQFLPKEGPICSWRFSNPGPLDASYLSVFGYPLLLRPHVVVGRGDGIDEFFDEMGHCYRESYDSKMGCCAVPMRFYELLRSIHGVKCDDGLSISFQPYSEENPYILHHHIISASRLSASTSSSPQCKSPTNYRDIDFPCSSSDIGIRTTQNLLITTSSSCSLHRAPSPRPLEFKRHVLFSRDQSHVEVYPMKWIYYLVDSTPVSPLSSVNASPEPPHSTKTVALLKAAANHLQESEPGFGKGKKPPRGNLDIPKLRVLPRRSSSSSSCRKNVPFSNPKGFVLVSRVSCAKSSLLELLRLACPDKSSTCCRMWTKVGFTPRCKNSSPATKSGDGYELLDVEKVPDDMSVYEFSKIYNGTCSTDNFKSMDLLIETRSHPNTKWKRSSLELSNRIQVGDFVDAQDSFGKWYEAVVRHVHDKYIKVHYFGWSSKWNAKIKRFSGKQDDESLEALPGPPAPLWSHSSRWRREIKVGDEVEVREASSLVTRPKWFRAFVREIGKEDDTPREIVGGAPLEELENCIDGSNKIVPLILLNSKLQALVEVPQERFNTSSTPFSLSPKNLSNGSVLTPQPPFLRWVNLYGEEICPLYTHNKPQRTTKSGVTTPATITYEYNPNRRPVEVLRSWNNIHGAGFIRESLRGVPPAPGSVGLHNLGNSCFLNSILQCLNHIEPLTQYFLLHGFIKDLNKNNPLGSGGKVALSYSSLLHDMWGGEYSTLAPRLLKQTVANFAPQFNNIYQHDSQEFCSFLMDGLHEDLNRVKNKPYVEDLEGLGMRDEMVAIESWKNHLLRHDSIIVDYCQGIHRSHLTCPSCANESVKFDVYSTISLPLIQNNDDSPITLTDCLKEFTNAEQLDAQNAWFCSKCSNHVCARKKITLWTTPDILILHLKRFHYDRCATGGLVRNKVENQVIFPVDNLDMAPYIMGPILDDAPAVYKLFGVSEHQGCTANSGHYTATVRNSRDGNWYRYNDSHVGITSGDASITGGAYLLFYQRSKGKARWAGMEEFIEKEQKTHSHPVT